MDLPSQLPTIDVRYRSAVKGVRVLESVIASDSRLGEEFYLCLGEFPSESSERASGAWIKRPDWGPRDPGRIVKIKGKLSFRYLKI